MNNLTLEIRDLINHPWKQNLLFKDKNTWHMLCASLDTIEDTELAIQEYRNKEKSQMYLPIYGILQTLFLQSDALSHLYKALFNKDVDFKTDYKEIYNIRELRNKTIGHPTNFQREGKKSYYVLNRHSIGEQGFQYIEYLSNGQTKHQSIDLHQIIAEQENLKDTILTEIKNKLEEEFKAHKKQFANQKLVNLMSKNLNYFFEKLYEFDKDIEISKIGLRMISNMYSSILQGLNERYLEEEGYPDGVTLLKEEIDFILSQLDYFFQNIQSTERMEVRLYIDQLKMKIKELESLLKEIDKEFSNSTP